ncbi:hypothetical protein [Stella sp.]|uniref:hypothetical protein n=1 Tax=Stella sp. TaxID=2912054 RepID=UPI0035B31355
MNPALHRENGFAGLDDEGWRRLHEELLGDLPRRNCYAPHIDAIHRRAFGAVRARILRAADAPPAAPVAYWVPKKNDEGRGGPQRRHSLLQPVEEAMWMLVGAAAIAAAEPALDRDRVHSSRPAAAGEPGLLTPPERWTRSFSAAVDAAIAGAGAVARLDVARCGERIDRGRLLAILHESGIGPGWLDAASRLFASCRPSLGPTGLPITGFVGASFVTIALTPLDRWCREHGVASVRMMDDTVLPAPDLDAAAKAAEGARGALAGIGLAVHPGKTVVQSSAAFRAERLRDRARMPGPAWSADEVLALFRATPEDDPRFQPIADAALARLAAAGDRRALPHLMDRFAHAPAAARTYAIHIARFMDDQAVTDRMAALLVGARRTLHPWQWAWGLSAFRNAPRVPGAFARGLSGLLADPAVPVVVRVAAAAIRTRFSTRADWIELERQIGQIRSQHTRAAIAWGLAHRPAAERRPLLRQWSARDPLIQLVAAALDPPDAGP